MTRPLIPFLLAAGCGPEEPVEPGNPWEEAGWEILSSAADAGLAGPPLIHDAEILVGHADGTLSLPSSGRDAVEVVGTEGEWVRVWSAGPGRLLVQTHRSWLDSAERLGVEMVDTTVDPAQVMWRATGIVYGAANGDAFVTDVNYIALTRIDVETGATVEVPEQAFECVVGEVGACCASGPRAVTIEGDRTTVWPSASEIVVSCALHSDGSMTLLGLDDDATHGLIMTVEAYDAPEVLRWSVRHQPSFLPTELTVDYDDLVEVDGGLAFSTLVRGLDEDKGVDGYVLGEVSSDGTVTTVQAPRRAWLPEGWVADHLADGSIRLTASDRAVRSLEPPSGGELHHAIVHEGQTHAVVSWEEFVATGGTHTVCNWLNICSEVPNGYNQQHVELVRPPGPS